MQRDVRTITCVFVSRCLERWSMGDLADVLPFTIPFGNLESFEYLRTQKGFKCHFSSLSAPSIFVVSSAGALRVLLTRTLLELVSQAQEELLGNLGTLQMPISEELISALPALPSGEGRKLYRCRRPRRTYVADHRAQS